MSRMDPHPAPLRRWATAAVAIAVVAVTAACSGDDDRSATESDGAPETPSADIVLSTTGNVVAELDPRYQSYNVEMVEVTGGEFWQPYDVGSGKVARPPIDLGSERLRNLARGLGPAYIRVSGSWANSTYFDADGTTGGVAPEGFNSVLTAEQWRGVGEFADAVDGKVVTSFPSSPGTREADGTWRTEQARSLLQFSVDHDVPVFAAELFNEPSLPVGMPAGYDADAFARDLAALEPVVEHVMPELLLLGPGSTAEDTPLVITASFTSEDVLERVGTAFDVFSYHSYPKVSERCGSTEGPEIALSAEYLGRIGRDASYYRSVRDAHLPGAPMWVTETAQAACGGDRWASTFRDVIRYVNTLGVLAAGDGDVVFHNTLAASDYGLLDEDGLVPRPNYWAAVLWARLMGPSVRAVADTNDVADLAVYAHCTPEGADEEGVTYAVLNSSSSESRTVTTGSGEATVYLLSGDIDGKQASLNGAELSVGDDGELPEIKGRNTSGAIEVPAASVAFVVDAGADGCP